tara:strand:- start:411 stop:1598 length:1188 start_codon:yes stop_codon:yes gene_type:complete
MTTTKGVWDIQEVRDKALAGIWKAYDDSGDPFKMYVWGNNQYGVLGLNEGGTPGDRYSSPVQIPGTTWSRVAGGNQYNLATKTDGTLWAWGRGGTANANNGVLGLGNNTHRSSPTQVPGTTWITPFADYSVSGCVKTDGTLWMWGYNEEGSLSQNNRQNYSSPRQVGSDTTWSQDKYAMDVSNMATYAIKTDGTLWSWGYNRNTGHAGHNNRVNYSSPVQIGESTNWSSVGKSWSGCFAVNTDGELYSWGTNHSGSLGQNLAHNAKRSSPVQVPGTTWSLVRGYSTGSSLGFKNDGTLWAWGANNYGQLGQNNRTQYSSPVQIPGTTWSANFSGGPTSSAAKTDGTLWTWGRADNGPLGQNEAGSEHKSSPVQVPGTGWSMQSTGSSEKIALHSA